ncbi:MAG: CBS domain-containing protein [Thermoplasmata archaeon]|nr:CBS domain-containing protein [Thermoplasmata archaeon]
MKVERIMTKKPIVAKLPGKREDVLKLMVKHKKTGLPVVKKDGTLIGFLARKHIFSMPDEDHLAILTRKDHPHINKDVEVGVAADLMLSSDLHHLPVVNRNKKVVGIVTPADFLGLVEDMESNRPVEDYVRAPCVSIYEDTPVKVASEIQRLSKVFALAVLNKNGRLSGLVTDRDIFGLAAISKRKAISDLGLPSEEDPWNYEGLKNVLRLFYEERKVKLPAKIKVKDIMVKDPTTVFRKSSVSAAAKVMRKKDFGQLPITDVRDRLFAMIYDVDLLVALLEKEG